MLGSRVDFPYLKYAYELAISHHEEWNGRGYPYGLAGEATPLAGRIMALADVYDALITRRVYKPPFPQESAYTTILEEEENVSGLIAGLISLSNYYRLQVAEAC